MALNDMFANFTFTFWKNPHSLINLLLLKRSASWHRMLLSDGMATLGFSSDVLSEKRAGLGL